MAAPARIVLVVTTLGRIERLQKLLDSAAPQLHVGDEVVVVAQANAERVETACLDASARSAATFTVTTSARGASLGRNTGVAASDPVGDPILLFPNDSSWFSPGSIDAIRAGMEDHLAGAVEVHTPTGPRFTVPDRGVPLDHRNVWKVIEPGLLMRRSIFDDLGGFDTSLGTGAQTPWQAGEGTDLLLRLLSGRSHTLVFQWMAGPISAVRGIDEAEGLSGQETHWKLRAYGRGIGMVYRRHGYPLWQQARFAFGGLAIGLRRRGEYGLLDGGPAFLGRLEGLAGRTLGHAAPPAVSR